MTGLRWSALVIAVALIGGGCQQVRELAGQGKRPPDEFTVYSRQPLSVPPNYALRPPVSGGQQAEEPPFRTNAKAALLGQRRLATEGPAPAAPADLSPGLEAMLDKTGATKAESDIRAIVNRETTILADADQSFTERLMFWTTPTDYGAVVNPVQEAKRIQDNQALGKPVVEGATPTIERKRRALLEGIF